MQEALSLHQAGNPQQAQHLYRAILTYAPHHPEAHYRLGVLAVQTNRALAGLPHFRAAWELKPDDCRYWSSYLAALITTGEPGAACLALELVLGSVAPLARDADVYARVGALFQDAGRLDGAERAYLRALECKPDFAEVHNNLGIVLKDAGRPDEAEAAYRRALEYKPEYAEAHNNLGNVLNGMGRPDEAEAAYRRALAYKPEYAEAHNNLGNALNGMGRPDEAEAAYRRALTCKPGYARAYNNLGNVLLANGRPEEAQAVYRRALEVQPDYDVAYSNLLFSLNYTAGHDPEFQREEAQRYGVMVAKKVGTPFSTWRCVPRPERLKVGVVSGDLHNHPVGYFLEGVLAQMDFSRIELFAYSTTFKTDELTKRISPYFSAWKPLTDQSDAAAAGLIHADGVHLLLDLAGHTARNRLPVFALKPAPVQLTWLGYPHTTGLPAIDYLLADAVTVPREEEPLYAETIWRLPDACFCFTPPATAVEVSPPPAAKNGYVTLGCFNNPSKINDRVLALWGEILRAVPDARLLLKYGRCFENEAGRRDMLHRCERAGIGGERIDFEGNSARAEFFSAYGRMDFALDPFPYTGATTTCEALWMGVPTLTLNMRRGIASRTGEMIMKSVGLAEWVAESTEEYVEKAVRFAGEPQRISKIRGELRGRLLTSTLCDAPRFARNFETALWGMWESVGRSHDPEKKAG